MTTSPAPRSLKEKQRQEREALILQTAEEVFSDKGYHETSMDEIATQVGIAKGTVYLHFPSKEDLLIAIFARDVKNVSAAIDQAIQSELTIQAKLEAVLQFMYSGFFSKRAKLLYSIYSNPELQQRFHEQGNIMRELWMHIAGRITELLDEGKATGQLDQSIPTPIMLSTFLSMQSPKGYHHLIVEQHMTAEEVVKYITKIYFKGISAV